MAKPSEEASDCCTSGRMMWLSRESTSALESNMTFPSLSMTVTRSSDGMTESTERQSSAWAIMSAYTDSLDCRISSLYLRSLLSWNSTISAVNTVKTPAKYRSSCFLYVQFLRIRMSAINHHTFSVTLKQYP